MKAPRPPLPVLVLLMCVCLLAPPTCARDGHEEFVSAAEEHALEEQPRPRARTPREPIPPEIFYDLTRYEWYRRGEPLLVDGAAYQPSGRPVPSMGRAFAPLGRFQGVTYYAASDAEPPYELVYVPVSPGYWQPFAPAAAAQAAEAAPT